MKTLTTARAAKLKDLGAVITRKPFAPEVPLAPPVAVAEPATPAWASALLAAISNLPRPEVHVAAPVVRVPGRPVVVVRELEVHSITRKKVQDRHEIDTLKVRVITDLVASNG